MALPPKLLRKFNHVARRSRRRGPMLFKLLGGVLVFAVLFAYILYKPPAQLISVLAAQYPDVLWRVDGLPKDHKIIALTIDDAPSEYTAEIAQVLAKYHARATFFVIGGQVKSEKDKEILVDLVRAGHELGNHAMHDEPSVSLGATTLVDQIHSVHDILSAAYRVATASVASGIGEGTIAELSQTRPPLYFRPGSGFFNSKMRKSLANLGYKLVLGDVYPHDPQIHKPKVNAAHVISMARPGSVIICHDRRPWTPPMLELVLSELVVKQGYEVTTVSKLLKAGEMAKLKGHDVKMGDDGKGFHIDWFTEDKDEDDKHVDGHGHAKGREQVMNVVNEILQQNKGKLGKGENKAASLAGRILGM
jgi:peptidoglycan/xylan/chitin deacetylase (PgdA/CDA1 family)